MSDETEPKSDSTEAAIPEEDLEGLEKRAEREGRPAGQLMLRRTDKAEEIRRALAARAGFAVKGQIGPDGPLTGQPLTDDEVAELRAGATAPGPDEAADQEPDPVAEKAAPGDEKPAEEKDR